MADASKLRGMRRGGLGAPPSLDEARMDLAAQPPSTREWPPAATKRALGPPEAAVALHARLDGRTMRRSGRTVQFATRVSPAFDSRIREIAMRDSMLLVEVLERAL